MAERKRSHPSYRLHRQSGQAVVTLTCSVTGKRKDKLLGEYDTTESWAEYARKIAEWEAAGRVLDGNAPEAVKPASGVTAAEVMLDWWQNQLDRYSVTDPKGRLPSRLYAHRSAVRITRATVGSMAAAEFGPLALQEVRRAMVAAGWSRLYVNQSVALIVRAFKRAVAREVVRAEVVQALLCVAPLERGELGVAEGSRRKAVPVEHVEAVKPHLSRQVRAVLDVMLLTAARCDEVVRMRPIDIDTTDKVWIYRPDGHKSEHHGHERLIHIGPRAQAIIRPFLEPRSGVESYLFSPAEAEVERRAKMHAQRKTSIGYGNRPGSNRKAEPKRTARDRYTTDTIR